MGERMGELRQDVRELSKSIRELSESLREISEIVSRLEANARLEKHAQRMAIHQHQSRRMRQRSKRKSVQPTTKKRPDLYGYFTVLCSSDEEED